MFQLCFPELKSCHYIVTASLSVCPLDGATFAGLLNTFGKCFSPFQSLIAT